jgi:hypothetical protein
MFVLMAFWEAPRFKGMLVPRASRLLLPRHQSRRALRAPLLDGEPTEPMPPPVFTVVTSTCAAFTRRGVEPSLIVSYFPKGRPPLLAFPSFVLRR